MLQNSPPSSPDYHPQPILNHSYRKRRLIARNLNGQGSQMNLPLQAFSACTDCDNDGSPCASLPLSSECTDQCVVITCTDPAHELSLPSNQLRRSSFICECGEDNCNAFDELLQCCNAYLPQGGFPSNGVDLSGFDFGATTPCDCDNTLPNLSSSSDSPSTINSTYPRTPSDFVPDDFLPFTNHSLSQDYHASPQPYFGAHQVFDTSHFVPLHSPIQSPSGMRSTFQPPQALQCMWANCNATFATVSELVGHVNVEHLCLSPNAPPQVAPPVAACRWDNCTLYPTPEMIPGPSNSTANYSLDILANHLLHDHLGLHPASPMSHHALWPMSNPHQRSASRPISVKSSPKEMSIDDIDSNVICHPCRWKGCTRTFSSHVELTDHLNVAHIGSGKAQYECHWEGCERNGERSFSSKQKICRHLQSHTGHRPFQCNICHQNFSEAATLQQHMRRHTQEKPYVCDHPDCGKAFAIAGALTIHKRTHNGHRPFKCSYCGRGFSESSNLTKHLRTHTGDRPYPCTVPGCDKAFARPDQLTRHMFVHNKAKSATIPVLQKSKRPGSVAGVITRLG